MKLIKYNKNKSGNNGNTTIINNSSNSSSGGNADIPSRGGSDRIIWGQSDTGEDIDGSMVVNGNITIKAIIPPTYEDDEDDDGEDIEEETGGGNLNVELNIISNKSESNEVFAKQHLYINYPHPNGSKQCVVDLIKSNSDNISSNTTKITNLTTTVNNHTTQISNLINAINRNTDDIDLMGKDVADIKDKINNLNNDLGGIDLSSINQTLELLKYGTYSFPVVLLAGTIEKYSYSDNTGTYHFTGSRCDRIKDINISYDGGLMTVELQSADNCVIYVQSSSVVQSLSGDTANNSTVTKSTHSDSTSIGGRNDGWHGFETWCSGGSTTTPSKIFIREFHQKDANNDSWGSDYWGGDGGGIRKVQIMAVGYAYKLSTAELTALIEAQTNNPN